MSNRFEWTAYYDAQRCNSAEQTTDYITCTNATSRYTTALATSKLSDSEFATFQALWKSRNPPSDDPTRVVPLEIPAFIKDRINYSLIHSDGRWAGYFYNGFRSYSFNLTVFDNIVYEKAVPSTPPPEPVAETVVIDGVTIDPNLTYTATVYNSAGDAISSGVFRGSDLIALADTNVTIKIGVDTIIEQPSPEQLEPKNPFVRNPDGTKTFIKENISKVVVIP